MSYVYEIPVFTLTAQVERYVTAHPRCTTRDVMEALEMIQSTARTTLERLRAAGRIRRIPKTQDERRIRWEIGEDDDYIPMVKDGPKRVMVSEWEPCAVRDPMIDALFGRNA